MKKRLPSEWEQLIGIEVIDPDGWDRTNFQVSWNTPITAQEFLDKCEESTIWCDEAMVSPLQ